MVFSTRCIVPAFPQKNKSALSGRGRKGKGGSAALPPFLYRRGQSMPTMTEVAFLPGQDKQGPGENAWALPCFGVILRLPGTGRRYSS